jgi:RHS repeat-associated protein
VSGAATDSFVYDGDGNRVKSNVNGTVTVFIGNYYEWETNATRKHYYAGTSRIAMRDGETLYFLFGDHLGSTSLSYRVSDGYVARHLYKPWGEKRYPAGGSELPTKYRFTGQYVQNELWLYYYSARWYDNRVGRFSWKRPMSFFSSQLMLVRIKRFPWVKNYISATKDLPAFSLARVRLHFLRMLSLISSANTESWHISPGEMLMR